MLSKDKRTTAQRVRERAEGKGIYILPNLFTTAGLFAGFFAIVQATKGNFELAAVAIFVAMFMDGMDGRIARITNTSSDFGMEYDSLSDVIAFGLTPALVIYEWGLINLGKLGWLASFLYVAATALRLARFNTQRTADKRYFKGLPSPAAAALIAAWVWLMETYGLGGKTAEVFGWTLTVGTALAMVGNCRYRSFKDFDPKGKVPFIALIALVMVFVVIAFDPPWVLFVLFFGYFLSGLVLAANRLLAHRAVEKEPVDTAPPPQADDSGGLQSEKERD